jgi:hypothetical protein
LDQQLQGIRIQNNQMKTAMVAYADDVTILATSPGDIIAIRDAVQQYEKATGAVVNIQKSQALPVGSWDTNLPVMNIAYTEEIKVLGFNMKKSIDQAGKACWARITNMIRSQAKETYGRDLNLVQRIQYVHVYLLAKLWHTAQVFPLPREYCRQIMSAIAWFIWQGAIFRVPISTLQRNKNDGGLEFCDVEAKSRALLIARIWTQGKLKGTLPAEWQEYWDIEAYKGNPPQINRIPRNVEYLRIYAQESAYIHPPRDNESPKAFRRRIYQTLRTLSLAVKEPRAMRISLIHPTTEWKKVWKNLQGMWAPDHIKSTWYKVIHDIYPTNERLRAINLSNTAQCNACGNHDSILHRITDCGTGSGLWEWTRRRIAWFLRTDPSYIPKDWVVRPQFDIWPPQRRRATLWILAHLIWYRLQKGHTPSEQEYRDFMRRARWKTSQSTGYLRQVGRYLEIL